MSRRGRDAIKSMKTINGTTVVLPLWSCHALLYLLLILFLFLYIYIYNRLTNRLLFTYRWPSRRTRRESDTDFKRRLNSETGVLCISCHTRYTRQSSLRLTIEKKISHPSIRESRRHNFPEWRFSSRNEITSNRLRIVKLNEPNNNNDEKWNV